MIHQIRSGPCGQDSFIGAVWRKATASDANSGCVEVGFLANGCVGIRDSKDRGNPAVVLTAHAWARFLADARSGQYDLLSRPSAARMRKECGIDIFTF